MSQAGNIRGGGSPTPPIIIQGYTAITFSGLVVSYTVLPTDYFISVDAQIPGTIVFPATPTNGTSFIIKDRTGMFSTNNVTISAGASTIDQATTYLMAGNFDSIQLLYHSNNYEIF